MAGPLGFFKGLYARVLYAMPATAICWSTYEFAKFILSQQSREEYQSSPKLPGVHLPKDILASAADKVRLDEKLGGLSYVLPSTSAGSKEFEEDDGQRQRPDSTTFRPARSSETTSSPISTTPSSGSTSSGSLLSRELPSMSGAGVYSSALSLNTMHTDSSASLRPGMPLEGRGCST